MPIPYGVQGFYQHGAVDTLETTKHADGFFSDDALKFSDTYLILILKFDFFIRRRRVASIIRCRIFA